MSEKVVKETKKIQEAWRFEFALYHDSDDRMLNINVPSELLKMIISWAEEHDCLVGGGFRAYTDEEKNDNSILYELPNE
ncbi:hypothetical protein U8527_21835 [Kordia algicida OT-1]|uniref:Uncharacterized protein n=1 Tax=Kordia algicida OT-1 TaxID=391587 RepID=A9DQB3_9FLAO|nr:hypothetical protein [Kordia algicida]EDP96617.1 hypothetical protein KAOT1_15678 [Kordia algicida OT-1]